LYLKEIRSRDLSKLNRLGLDVFLYSNIFIPTSRYNYRACVE